MKLDALENRGVEDVDTGINTVAYELDGFLDETVDARGVVWLVYNDTELRRLFDLCDDNGTLVAVAAVELEEIGKWVVADDIGVEDEEGRVVLCENLLGELEGTGGSEGL